MRSFARDALLQSAVVGEGGGLAYARAPSYLQLCLVRGCRGRGITKERGLFLVLPTVTAGLEVPKGNDRK